MVAITSASANRPAGESSPLIYSNEKPETSTVNELPNLKKTRKQWSVQGEPRSLLKRLRSQLAEDGCPESQLLMAKTLLEHTEDQNYEENCLQAIFWLTQASLQGCVGATELLQECLEKGLGISEQNYQDVKRCLEMDHQEKLALVAGKHLFTSLSEGNDFVTQRMLESRIEEIIGNKEENFGEKKQEFHKMKTPEIKRYLEENYSSKRLTEGLIMEAALEFANGELPSLCLLDAIVCSPVSLVLRPVVMCHDFILNFIRHNVYEKLLFICKGSKVSFFIVLSFVCFICYMFNWKKFTLILIFALWVVCFSVMCCCSFLILIRHKDRLLYNVWSNVFYSYNKEIDLNIATTRYKKKSLHYYLAYYGSLLACLLLLPFVNTAMKALVVTPLFLISFCLLAASFRDNCLFYLLCSLFYVIAHNPNSQAFIEDNITRLLPVSKLYLFQGSVNIYNTLYVNLDLASVFHSLWFVTLVFVAINLGPLNILFHTLTVTWFHFTFVVVNDCVGYGIYISLIMWLLVIVLPHGLKVLSVLMPSLLFSFCCYLNGIGFITAFLVGLTLGTSFLVISCLNTKLSSVLKYIFVILSLVFIFTISTERRISSLKWDQYQNICIPSKETVGIHPVISCLPFKGTLVQWPATVKSIETESVYNIPESVLSYFPSFMQHHLRCLLGSPPRPCSEYGSEIDRHRCQILKDVKGADYCSLELWNEFRFKFIVSMESNFWKFTKSSDVILQAENDFKKAAFDLSVHDRISFVGILEDDLGMPKPKISLISLSCIDCCSKNVGVLDPFQFPFDNITLLESVKSTFNFIFGPTVIML